MVKKDEIVRFVTDEETVAALDLLAEKTKTNRSVVIRELIPHSAVVEAMAEQAALNGEDGRNIARDIANRNIIHLTEQMIDDHDHPIGLQYEIQCGGLDPFIKTAWLYTKWARAKRGISGYRFEQIPYQGEARFTIVVGPTDDDVVVEALKKGIVEYAEKLGIRK